MSKKLIGVIPLLCLLILSGCGDQEQIESLKGEQLQLEAEIKELKTLVNARSSKAAMYTYHNMLGFQTMIETYSKDHEKHYPAALSTLYKAAVSHKSPYFTYATNLLNKKSWTTQQSNAAGIIESYEADKKYAPGVVVYRPKADKHNRVTEYTIYGIDDMGKPFPTALCNIESPCPFL